MIFYLAKVIFLKKGPMMKLHFPQYPHSCYRPAIVQLIFKTDDEEYSNHSIHTHAQQFSFSLSDNYASAYYHVLFVWWRQKPIYVLPPCVFSFHRLVCICRLQLLVNMKVLPSYGGHSSSFVINKPIAGPTITKSVLECLRVCNWCSWN